MSKKMESELDCTIDLAVLRGSFIGADTKLEFEDDGLGNYTGKNKFYQFLATEFPEQTERMIKFNRRNVSFFFFFFFFKRCSNRYGKYYDSNYFRH